MLFYFQDIVTRYVKSSDFCNAYVYDILKWAIPKVIFRCKLLNDAEMRDYYGIDIMIVLDVWIAICCALSLIYIIRRLIVNKGIITRNDMLEYYISRQGDGGRLIFAVYGCYGIVILLVLFIFIYSPGTDDGGGGFQIFTLTSSYGLGVALHASVAASCSYFLLMATLSLKTLRSLSSGDLR